MTRTTSPAAPVDTTPPTVSTIERVDATPTAAASIRWTVTFTEPVTGVDVADFALVSGVAGAALSSVTGSGTTWTVTASTGTGNGTIVLNLVDDDSIRDAAGNRLGGTGTGNGNSTGPTYTIDRTAPSVTIDQKAGTTDPTNSPLWTVTFSRAVTGFDVTDLVRTGTSAGGALAVTGSGASYEVSLTGTPTDGTVVLTVRAGAADAGGVPSIASTSTDNSITVDRTAPVIRSATTTAGNGNKETFSGTTSESGGQLVITVVNASTGAGVKAYTATPATTPSGGNYAWTVDTQPQDLVPGTSYRFSVVHTDAAGNASASFAGSPASFSGN